MSGLSGDAMRMVKGRLAALQDMGYRTFIAGLLPTLDQQKILGVRTPALRKLAKELHAEGIADAFMAALPHNLYEENNLHAYLLDFIRNIEHALELLERFLPHVDNWATCDALILKAFDKDPSALLARVPIWLTDQNPYTQRYAIGVLMRHYLGDRFEEEYLTTVGNHTSDEYYVNMMRAWYFSMALVKQWDATIPWLTEKRLDAWTHRKAIQKAVESHQISAPRKDFLKTLR